jgi:hypothetical protein
MAGLARRCRLHQRGGVRDRRQLDAGPPRRSLATSAWVGFRRRRCWHRPVRCARARPAESGMAVGMVDRRGIRRCAQRGRVDHGRKQQSRKGFYSGDRAARAS